MDSTGAVVVDAIVYGSRQSNSSGNGTIASPELATLESDQGKGGCIVVVPTAPRGSGPAGAADAPNRTVGRFPDGGGDDNMCADFHLQTATTLSAASVAGAANLKVASVAEFSAGQAIVIDAGGNQEAAFVATVGTAGASSVGAATFVGATVIPVANGAGFTVGQAITVDDGANQETAVVAAASGGRGGRGGAPGVTLTVVAPLKNAHAAGAQVSGSGITLTAPLVLAHANGSQVASAVPTPGAPNKY